MTLLPLTRLTILGFLLVLPGAYFGLRFSSGFLRMLVRKFRKGRAYLQGSATDYFWFAAGSWVIVLLGVALLACSILQGGLQPYEEAQEIGSLRVEAPGAGRMRLEVDLGEAHPVRGKVETDLPGVRWALEGEFLEWRGAPRWLGFSNAHRVEAVIASSSPSGSPDRAPDARSLVAGTYSPWYLVRHHPGWVPFARASVQRTPWLPAESSAFKLLATKHGYVLVTSRSEDGEKPRD